MAKGSDIFFFDITKTGKDLGGTDDVPIITNTNAVVESLHNLILTNPGERLMNPTYGVNLSKYLFEPCETYVAGLIVDDLYNAISKHEPRCQNVEVIVEPYPDDNTFIITISFETNLDPNRLQVQVTLNKIR